MKEHIHDKHLYFFEKFIRNEMNADEKFAFENRLLSDNLFKQDFNKYIANRNIILQQELDEYNEPIIPQNANKYSWLYIIISILCLVFVIDFYVNKKYEESIAHKPSVIDKINIFKHINDKINSYNKNDNAPIIITEEKDTLITKTNKITKDTVVNNLKIDGEDIEEANTDVMLFDTLLSVVDFDAFKEKQKNILFASDSLLNDSASSELALRSIIKNNIKAKQQQIYVEYWQSPQDYSGYRFNGKKLILFGQQKPDNIYLLKHLNQIILYLSFNEILLISDNSFHNY